MPRKFSEKIALLKQKEAEINYSFDNVMNDLKDVSPCTIQSTVSPARPDEMGCSPENVLPRKERKNSSQLSPYHLSYHVSPLNDVPLTTMSHVPITCTRSLSTSSTMAYVAPTTATPSPGAETAFSGYTLGSVLALSDDNSPLGLSYTSGDGKKTSSSSYHHVDCDAFTQRSNVEYSTTLSTQLPTSIPLPQNNFPSATSFQHSLNTVGNAAVKTISLPNVAAIASKPSSTVIQLPLPFDSNGHQPQQAACQPHHIIVTSSGDMQHSMHVTSNFNDPSSTLTPSQYSVITSQGDVAESPGSFNLFSSTRPSPQVTETVRSLLSQRIRQKQQMQQRQQQQQHQQNNAQISAHNIIQSSGHDSTSILSQNIVTTIGAYSAAAPSSSMSCHPLSTRSTDSIARCVSSEAISYPLTSMNAQYGQTVDSRAIATSSSPWPLSFTISTDLLTLNDPMRRTNLVTTQPQPPQPTSQNYIVSQQEKAMPYVSGTTVNKQSGHSRQPSPASQQRLRGCSTSSTRHIRHRSEQFWPYPPHISPISTALSSSFTSLHSGKVNQVGAAPSTSALCGSSSISSLRDIVSSTCSSQQGIHTLHSTVPINVISSTASGGSFDHRSTDSYLSPTYIQSNFLSSLQPPIPIPSNNSHDGQRRDDSWRRVSSDSAIHHRIASSSILPPFNESSYQYPIVNVSLLPLSSQSTNMAPINTINNRTYDSHNPNTKMSFSSSAYTLPSINVALDGSQTNCHSSLYANSSSAKSAVPKIPTMSSLPQDQLQSSETVPVNHDKSQSSSFIGDGYSNMSYVTTESIPSTFADSGGIQRLASTTFCGKNSDSDVNLLLNGFMSIDGFENIPNIVLSTDDSTGEDGPRRNSSTIISEYLSECTSLGSQGGASREETDTSSALNSLGVNLMDADNFLVDFSNEDMMLLMDPCLSNYVTDDRTEEVLLLEHEHVSTSATAINNAMSPFSQFHLSSVSSSSHNAPSRTSQHSLKTEFNTFS